MGRGDDAHVDVDVDLALQRTDALVLERALQLGLQRQRQLADLVEQHRATAGLRERARTLAAVARGALAEQLALELGLGQGRAADDHERVRAATRVLVQRACGQLLAGAALAGDEHRRVGLGRAREQLVGASHGCARARQRAEAGRRRDQLAQTRGLVADAALADDPRHAQTHGFDRDRLLDVVVGPGSDRGDGRLHACKRGHHDDGQIGPFAAELGAEFEPAHARQVHVREHDVVAAVLDRLEPGFGAVAGVDREVLRRQPGDQQRAEIRVVVDHQHATRPSLQRVQIDPPTGHAGAARAR
ncbi:MAG: hypothetical protein U0168_01265 [Nannocystaceae bacterium]